MDALFFVLRTGGQWHARHETGLWARSAAPRRCQEWTEADVFRARWEKGLLDDAA
jgi:transposase